MCARLGTHVVPLIGQFRNVLWKMSMIAESKRYFSSIKIKEKYCFILNSPLGTHTHTWRDIRKQHTREPGYRNVPLLIRSMLSSTRLIDKLRLKLSI